MGVRTLAVAADVTDRAAVDASVERVREEFGPVDLLLHSAGMFDAAEVPLWEAAVGRSAWRAGRGCASDRNFRR